MKKLEILVFPLLPLPTNCYLIHGNGVALAIDPGGHPDALVLFIAQKKLTLTHILLTHLHSDHTVGAKPLSRACGAPIFASAKDGWMLNDYLGKGDDDWGIPPVEPFSFEHLTEGELLLCSQVCTVLETPGHSPGGLTFYFPDLEAAFPGDTLFRNSAGRTDFSGGCLRELKKSLHEKLFHLPETTRIFPGHGRSFTLKENALYQDFVARR